jgi:NAD(P)-dependent dehydrogenase (short-subunit alcohol dehydrogenase family)
VNRRDATTVLVTGAAGAIGGAVVRQFVRAGYRVACHDQVDPATRSGEVWLRGDIVGQGGRDMVREAYDRLGRLEVVVHCAGGADPRPLLDISDAEWDEIMELNGSVTFRVCQEAARLMVGLGRGTIIVISSLCARMAERGFAHYCSAKAATEMLCKSMAVELAPYGIQVNAVLPGTIDTPLTDRVGLDESARSRLIARTPMRRMGLPEEIADVVFWLASAPPFLTGESVIVDGGYSIDITP